MEDHQPDMRALRREWWAARIVGTLGAVLLIVVLGSVAVMKMSGPARAPAPTSPIDTAAARRAEDIALCDAALAATQDLKLLPAYARRDGDTAGTTAVQGRYVCHARTEAAKYTITFDLGCTDLSQAGCIGLYTIEQQGGGVIYQRP
jgi:hypothetical protein